MLNLTNQSRLHPSINVKVQVTADMITGDGVFDNTDLMRLTRAGHVLVHAVGDDIAHTIEVPQMNHQPNYTNHIPVIESGIAPAQLKIPSYKIFCPAGSSPVVLVDLTTGTNVFIEGSFYPLQRDGSPSIVAQNTPDILVFKKIATSAQNILEDTDLEYPPYGGITLCWSMSDNVDNQIAVRQRNYRAGNYSLIPSDGAGLSVDISKQDPIKQLTPKGGQPAITVTNSGTDPIFVCAAFFARM